ncbi:MAG: hypothetical protein K1X67_22265 [Fimbriimonadaceae bacterium]|nr:hypothetical protein [Fimbriimonadaceae bacterium]
MATATYTADSLAVDTVTTPASGTGTLKTAYIYQYPGGLLERVNSPDESNTVIRSVKSFYGKEGELKEVQDHVASATLSKYTYDELYNVKEFFDGNNNKTTWTRNLNQQVTQVNYPGKHGGNLTSSHLRVRPRGAGGFAG